MLPALRSFSMLPRPTPPSARATASSSLLSGTSVSGYQRQLDQARADIESSAREARTRILRLPLARRRELLAQLERQLSFARAAIRDIQSTLTNLRTNPNNLSAQQLKFQSQTLPSRLASLYSYPSLFRRLALVDIFG